jgi:hypothetical protein
LVSAIGLSPVATTHGWQVFGEVPTAYAAQQKSLEQCELSAGGYGGWSEQVIRSGEAMKCPLAPIAFFGPLAPPGKSLIPLTVPTMLVELKESVCSAPASVSMPRQ